MTHQMSREPRHRRKPTKLVLLANGNTSIAGRPTRKAKNSKISASVLNKSNFQKSKSKPTKVPPCTQNLNSSHNSLGKNQNGSHPNKKNSPPLDLSQNTHNGSDSAGL